MLEVLEVVNLQDVHLVQLLEVLLELFLEQYLIL